MTDISRRKLLTLGAGTAAGVMALSVVAQAERKPSGRDHESDSAWSSWAVHEPTQDIVNNPVRVVMDDFWSLGGGGIIQKIKC